MTHPPTLHVPSVLHLVLVAPSVGLAGVQMIPSRLEQSQQSVEPDVPMMCEVTQMQLQLHLDLWDHDARMDGELIRIHSHHIQTCASNLWPSGHLSSIKSINGLSSPI